MKFEERIYYGTVVQIVEAVEDVLKDAREDSVQIYFEKYAVSLDFVLLVLILTENSRDAL